MTKTIQEKIAVMQAFADGASAALAASATPQERAEAQKSYTFIGDDCPPGYRRVGTIDVADPADVHRAEDRGYRIGSIYDGRSGSCAEPCAADIYKRPDEPAATEKPIAHLVWLQGRRGPNDVEDYYEVDRPSDKSLDGSEPFPVYALDADWKEDPAQDERWNAGLDYAMTQLCALLSVDPQTVTWDAATETLDGDVQAVLGNILRKHLGENWGPTLSAVSAPEVEAKTPGLNSAPKPFAWWWEDKTGCLHLALDGPDVFKAAREVFCEPQPLYTAASGPGVKAALPTPHERVLPPDVVDKATAWDHAVKSGEKARSKALEEALEIVEHENTQWLPGGPVDVKGMLRNLAKKIRALSSTAKEG